MAYKACIYEKSMKKLPHKGIEALHEALNEALREALRTEALYEALCARDTHYYRVPAIAFVYTVTDDRRQS